MVKWFSWEYVKLQHKYKLVLGWVTIWWVVLLIWRRKACYDHNINQEPYATRITSSHNLVFLRLLLSTPDTRICDTLIFPYKVVFQQKCWIKVKAIPKNRYVVWLNAVYLDCWQLSSDLMLPWQMSQFLLSLDLDILSEVYLVNSRPLTLYLL